MLFCTAVGFAVRLGVGLVSGRSGAGDGCFLFTTACPFAATGGLLVLPLTCLAGGTSVVCLTGSVGFCPFIGLVVLFCLAMDRNALSDSSGSNDTPSLETKSSPV